MSLNEYEIIEMMIEYLKDERYKQAILIDGEWGAGKTYFIKEKLLGQLREVLPKLSSIYISLYGLSNVNQIIDEICNIQLIDYIDKKLEHIKKEESKMAKIFSRGKITKAINGENVTKGIDFGGKLISPFLKYFNFDIEDVPSFSNIERVKDSLIIFDDLERCSIDINEVFGFINHLVEHNNLKVIIVANQKEIGKIKNYTDLPNKYLVALDARLALGEEKAKQRNEDNSQETISKKELISRTESIFSEDITYKAIAEKLIGMTVYYEVNLENVYETILSK